MFFDVVILDFFQTLQQNFRFDPLKGPFLLQMLYLEFELE